MTSVLRLPVLIILSAIPLLLVGCDSPDDRLDAIQAGLPASGRAGAVSALRSDFDAGKITFEASLIRAESLLEAGDTVAPTFAGAVLDLAVQIEDQLPSGPEFELFWLRIGQLASKATYQAMQSQRFDEAASLVLAGPKRWQRETYWRRYPHHDIMVAVSMAQQGETGKGISRLRSRAIQTPDMERAIEQIRELDRELLRKRLREKIEQEQDDGG